MSIPSVVLLTCLFSLLYINVHCQTWVGDNRTYWQSTSNFSVSYGTSYGKIVLGTGFRMTFQFLWQGRDNDSAVKLWESIFRIGASAVCGDDCDCAYTRYPALFIRQNVDQFHFSVADSIGCAQGYGGTYGNRPDAIKDEVTQWVIDYNDTWVFVQVDDYVYVNQSKDPTSNNYLGEEYTVWIGSDSSTNETTSPAANGVIWDIDIEFYGQPTTSPTPEPILPTTYDPTVDPTVPSNDPTIDPTTDPTSDPTTDPTTTEPTVDPVTTTSATTTEYSTIVSEFNFSTTDEKSGGVGDSSTTIIKETEGSGKGSNGSGGDLGLLIGIIIGVLCVILLLVLFIFWYCKKKKEETINKPNIVSNNSEYTKPPEQQPKKKERTSFSEEFPNGGDARFPSTKGGDDDIDDNDLGAMNNFVDDDDDDDDMGGMAVTRGGPADNQEEDPEIQMGILQVPSRENMNANEEQGGEMSPAISVDADGFDANGFDGLNDLNEFNEMNDEQQNPNKPNQFVTPGDDVLNDEIDVINDPLGHINTKGEDSD